MYKRVIDYVDFDGNKRSEDCYFNYTKTELNKLNIETDGGVLAWAQSIVSERNGKKLIQLFEKIILGAYGIKSADGRTFHKSEEISKEFASTNAYDVLFTELSTDAAKFAEFFNNIIPADSKLNEKDLNQVMEQANEKASALN